MDFYEEASLVMVPSGYKDQKVYSSVPDDGSGDLTFSRASSATRVGPDELIEKVRTNLAWPSADFTTNWVSNNGSVTANTTANPIDGAVTADTFTATAAAGSRVGFEKNFTSQTGDVTASTYFKYTNNQWVFLAIYDTNNAIYRTAAFDIQNGVVGVKSSGVTSTITSVGGGFYRCLLTFPIATSTNIYHSQGILNSNVTGVTSTTSGGESFIAFGAQLEQGVATDYIATTSAAVSVGPVANLPRLDYLGSTCPKLLLEGQRTNALTYSEQIDNAAWTKVLASSLANDTTSPDGYTNADKIRPNSGVTFSIPASGIYTAGASSYIRSSGLTLTAASYTFSAFVKKGEYDYIQLRSGTSIDTTANGSGVTVNLNNGTTTATSGYSIEDYGDGWYRISHTFTATATTWYLNFWFWNSTSVTANGTDGVYVYGAQLEEGAYATSYIPTLGAAVTRLADVASKTGISSLIGQTEGVLFYDFVWNGATTSTADYPIVLSGSDFNNFIGLNTTFNSNQLLAYSGGVPVASIAGSDFVIGQRYKIALAYKANDFVYYVNGTLQGSDTSGAVPIGLANLQMVTPFGSKSTVQNANSILFFQTRLSNADLATLTTL
jgi:hypothetical protein